VLRQERSTDIGVVLIQGVEVGEEEEEKREDDNERTKEWERRWQAAENGSAGSMSLYLNYTTC